MGKKNALLMIYFGIVLSHNTSCVMVKHFARRFSVTDLTDI